MVGTWRINLRTNTVIFKATFIALSKKFQHYFHGKIRPNKIRSNPKIYTLAVQKKQTLICSVKLHLKNSNNLTNLTRSHLQSKRQQINYTNFTRRIFGLYELLHIHR